MGLFALIALYGLSAATLALCVRAGGKRAHPVTALLFALLPMVFTAEGFLPQRTLAPTRLFAYVAPWADPELIEEIEQRGTATNPLLVDPAGQMIPWERAARDGWLFNPAAAAGSALLGNGQSAVLFPTEALGRLLPPFRAVTYRQSARLLLALWGMFLLGRLVGLGEWGAVVGAAVFVGSGFLQLWRLHPHSNVAAVAPWIVAAAVMFLLCPNRHRAIVLGLSLAAGALAGHPETLLHVLLFTALVSPLLARREKKGPSLGALLGWGLCAVLLAALLAAPALLPLIENLRDSVEWQQFRGERRAQSEVAFAEALTRLRPAAALLALGDPLRGSWSGPEVLAELGGGALGAPALLLALLGLGTSRRATLLFAVGVVGLLVSAHVPVISVPFSLVPLLRDSLLKRLGLWWVLAGALLGAGAIERARSGYRMRAATFLGAASIVAVAVVLVQREAPAPERTRILGLELLPLLATFVALGLLQYGFLARRSSWRNVTCALILVALVLPRAIFFARWVPVVPPHGFYPKTLAVQEVAERLAVLPAHGFRVAGIGSALPPSSGAFYGFEDVRPNDPLTFAPYAAFLNPLGEVPRVGWTRLLRPTGPALDFLGVRYVFDAVSAHRVDPNVPVYVGPEGVVWERPGALPRAFFPRAVLKAPLADAVELAHDIEDFAELVVVSGDTPSSVNSAARVLDLEVGRGRVRALVAAPAEAVLATSQPAIPGWQLHIDGEASPYAMRRINGAFLGALVPRGEHEVVFRYRPRSWEAGVALAFVGIILAAALALSNRHAAATWQSPHSTK